MGHSIGSYSPMIRPSRAASSRTASHIPGAGLRNSSKSQHAKAFSGTPILRQTNGSFLVKSVASFGFGEAWFEMRTSEYLVKRSRISITSTSRQEAIHASTISHPSRCSSRSFGTTSGLQNSQSNESFGNDWPPFGLMIVPSKSILTAGFQLAGRRRRKDEAKELRTERRDSRAWLRSAVDIVSAPFAALRSHPTHEVELPLPDEDRLLRPSPRAVTRFSSRRLRGSVFSEVALVRLLAGIFGHTRGHRASTRRR